MTKKVIIIIISVIAAAVLGVGIYGYSLYSSLNKTTENIYEPLERGETSKLREKKPDEDDPISILLLGVDARPGERGRTDTIMVMTINPQQKNAYLLSIPRDTRTEIIGRGVQDKINHAYAFGGIDMTIDTVENFLDIPIDYYALVNMEGFVSIIDILGGVTVDVTQNFDYDGHSFREGEMTMDGQAALAYSRMRKQDPRGDFGRNDRQRQIIKALISEAASVKTLWKVDDIMEVIEDNVRTNKDQEDINRLSKHYLDAARNLESLTLSGQGQTINGVYYFIVDDTERQRIQSILKDHMQLN
ncbi:LCP family protein required for cell wall assembly [Caldalkalibacillus uzonensis]|uniref:LCP family protein required for cell wall assembly n=1 Tax=Caldalkalibacillus uzonensis TaxID=353224 RepID=A0ABU0CQ31_9BACI|nr:LCP family protein [Caldalkalibacillus uzonensis]MDQ0338513.1 LCP family protein required for cell wall assembly [Caldalkalibacillus uzonensis]